MRALKSIIVLILTWEARAVLARYKPHVIAITGNVGKTTTKDAIYATFAGDKFVRKSEKSFNSETGVPLTILGLENAWRSPAKWLVNIVRGLSLILIKQKYPKWLIVEVGADRPGDIRRVARWLRPDIAVLTGVPEMPVHVEYFDSPEALRMEKRSLAEYVKPGGSIVINGDDIRTVSLCAKFKDFTRTYGFGESNDIRASHEEIIYEGEKPTGMRFRLEHSKSRTATSLPVSISGSLGRPHVYAALAAFAVGEIVEMDSVSIASSLADWEPTPGRMRIISGKNGSVIIDDTYNSSPAAVLSALDALKEVNARRRIAVLGDMMELGKYSAEAHRNVGVRAADASDTLNTVGFRSRVTGEAALDAGMSENNIREYEQNESARAGRELAQEIQEGDVVLVKGSQAVRMERAVKELMAEPHRAEELLVRHDEEWIKR